MVIPSTKPPILGRPYLVFAISAWICFDSASALENTNSSTLKCCTNPNVSIRNTEREQGQNFTMIAAKVILIVLAPGAVWSLDSLLGIF